MLHGVTQLEQAFENVVDRIPNAKRLMWAIRLEIFSALKLSAMSLFLSGVLEREERGCTGSDTRSSLCTAQKTPSAPWSTKSRYRVRKLTDELRKRQKSATCGTFFLIDERQEKLVSLLEVAEVTLWGAYTSIEKMAFLLQHGIQYPSREMTKIKTKMTSLCHTRKLLV